MVKRGAQSDLNHGNWNDEEETPALKPAEGGTTPFSLLIGIAKPTNGTAATTSARGASIFATTDPSKQVFSRVGSPPKEDTAGSTGKHTGDEKVKENSVCKLTPIFKISKVDTKEPTAVKPLADSRLKVPATTPNTAAAPTPPADKPFSFEFGSTSSTTGTGFRFPNVVKPNEDSKPDEKATTDDDEDEPFKVEFTSVKEKNSIFSKPCTNGNYSTTSERTANGNYIGTLHIKKMDGKVQALTVPVRGMGKNNGMLVCVPTPETKPPPTSVLLWVKTGEEAVELYETLLKQKPNLGVDI
ncbi:nucleoporin [Culex quinquefasciatus]|uniref:Nucleoporin n=1 Tax=Culex quinquefasciatus TaxID=7176 RepID=B0XGQ9_CULQU|nr:nucleoporin [Culex quinquefasciatus]|eukprot:XP_001868831.1 nucleoporin [Culex quinquefasciatus]